MSKNKKNKILPTIIISLLIIGFAAFSGYFVGNIISTKYFHIDKYQNLSPEDLKDKFNLCIIEGKTPDEFSGALAFQIAEELLMASTNYEVTGFGYIDTSIGVTQTSATIDRRNGDELYLAFTTYSGFVKTSRQCNYTIGGNIKMYEGNPVDSSVENTVWSDKYTEYTWDEYTETFGKVANKNCSYLVSSKTTKQDSGATKDGDLYKFSLVLDEGLASLCYRKQIGNNVGMDPSTIIFNAIEVAFWLDKNFNFVKQEKHESYTVPYGGVSMTLDANIETNFKIGV